MRQYGRLLTRSSSITHLPEDSTEYWLNHAPPWRFNRILTQSRTSLKIQPNTDSITHLPEDSTEYWLNHALPLDEDSTEHWPTNKKMMNIVSKMKKSFILQTYIRIIDCSWHIRHYGTNWYLDRFSIIRGST